MMDEDDFDRIEKGSPSFSGGSSYAVVVVIFALVLVYLLN